MNEAQEIILLRGWIDFLDAQMALFERMAPFTADDLNVSFWRVDESLHKQTIENAVSEFAVRDKWPELAPRQFQLLSLRAYMGRGVLLSILGTPTLQKQIRPPLPNLAHKERMIDWLLIRAWDVAGDQALEALIAGFLRGDLPNQAGVGRREDRRNLLN